MTEQGVAAAASLAAVAKGGQMINSSEQLDLISSLQHPPQILQLHNNNSSSHLQLLSQQQLQQPNNNLQHNQQQQQQQLQQHHLSHRQSGGSAPTSQHQSEQDILELQRELAEVLHSLGDLQTYFLDVPEKMGQSFEHMKAVLDRRYQAMLKTFLNVQQKIKELAQKLRMTEAKLTQNPQFRTMLAECKIYQDFSDVLSVELHRLTSLITKHEARLTTINALYLAKKHTLSDLNDRNLALSTLITRAQRRFNHLKQASDPSANQQLPYNFFYLQNNPESKGNDIQKIERICGATRCKTSKANIRSPMPWLAPATATAIKNLKGKFPAATATTTTISPRTFLNHESNHNHHDHEVQQEHLEYQQQQQQEVEWQIQREQEQLYPSQTPQNSSKQATFRKTTSDGFQIPSTAGTTTVGATRTANATHSGGGFRIKSVQQQFQSNLNTQQATSSQSFFDPNRIGTPHTTVPAATHSTKFPTPFHLKPVQLRSNALLFNNNMKGFHNQNYEESNEIQEEPDVKDILRQIEMVSNSNDRMRAEIIAKSNTHFSQIGLLKECLTTYRTYLESNQRIVQSRDGLAGSLLFEITKFNKAEQQPVVHLLKKQPKSSSKIMDRESKMLVHDTLKNMVNRKFAGAPLAGTGTFTASSIIPNNVKSATTGQPGIGRIDQSTRIKTIDPKVFSTFSPIQLVGMMTLHPSTFDDIPLIMERKSNAIHARIQELNMVSKLYQAS